MVQIAPLTIGGLGRELPAQPIPPPLPLQERYLRLYRVRLTIVSFAVVVLLAHNQLLLGGERFTYVLIVLLSLLDNALFFYLTYRGFLIEFLMYFRLALDAFAVTFVCHLTGSLTSVAPMGYILLIAAAAILTRRRHALFCAGAASVFYVTLLFLEYRGFLAYASLIPSFRIPLAEKPLTLVTNALFVPVLVMMTALLVSHLAAQGRRTEEELRTAHHSLARASGELMAAQAKLAHSERLASLGTLVAGVAHELNNPIGFVQSNLETLEGYADRLERYALASEGERERLAGELRIDLIRQEMPSLLHDCKEGSRRCREIVESLKDFSRPALKHPRTVLLEELVEKALRLMAVHLKDRIAVSRAFALNEPVRCYPGQLSQVLTNLLLNAAQAIEGPGEIIVETGSCGPNEVYVRICDSGKGMAADELPHIFDPFYTTKEPGQGTGLGLAISYSIVAEQGGRIEVASTPGEGTTFTVIVPRELPAVAEGVG